MACLLYTPWSVALGPDYPSCLNPHHPHTDLLVLCNSRFRCSACEILLAFLHSVGLFIAQDFVLGLLWSFSFLPPWWSVLSLIFYFALGKSSKMPIQMKLTRGMWREAYAEAMGKHSSLANFGQKWGPAFYTCLAFCCFQWKIIKKIKTCPEVRFASLPQPSAGPLTSGNNVT